MEENLSRDGQGNNRRILIIDDEALIWETYQAILADRETLDRIVGWQAAVPSPYGGAGGGRTVGFELSYCSQGKDGAEQVQRMREQGSPYAVAFVDMRMPPGWDGLRTATRIREIDPDIELVIVTAYGDYSLAEIVASVGSPEKLLILRKPFDPEEIVQLALSLTQKWNVWVEQQRQNEQLEKAYAELQSVHAHMVDQEKMASLGMLAAGVAHEINNPVGFIASNLSTLQKYLDKLTTFMNKATDLVGSAGKAELSEALASDRKQLKVDFVVEDISALLTESLEGTEQIKSIVQGLKKFSRADEAVCELADINECLESTIRVVWNELKYKAKVVKEYGELPKTRCYPQQLNQVFMNLLVNAAQAIPEFGEIRVKTWLAGEMIMAEIADTGSGIAPDKLGRIFEPFYTTKESGKGTGLGLSIVQEIVTQRHGGDIRVASDLDRGTVFTIQLPCRP